MTTNRKLQNLFIAVIKQAHKELLSEKIKQGIRESKRKSNENKNI